MNRARKAQFAYYRLIWGTRLIWAIIYFVCIWAGILIAEIIKVLRHVEPAIHHFGRLA